MKDSKQKKELIKDGKVMITSSISDLEKMLENADMQTSMQWMQSDLTILRSSFSKPLRIFNKIPML